MLEHYTAQSSLAGTPGDEQLAYWTRDVMLRFGVPEVAVEPYEVLLSYPLSRSLQLIAPAAAAFEASLQEPALDADPTSKRDDIVPTCASLPLPARARARAHASKRTLARRQCVLCVGLRSRRGGVCALWAQGGL
jgi:hypothetical protein